MEDIRRQGKLCDVNLRVGENVFSAHRIVLAATIPYFRFFHKLTLFSCKLGNAQPFIFCGSQHFSRILLLSYNLITSQGHVHPRHGGGKAA